MSQGLRNRNILTWKRAGSLGKVVAVICAFLAFAINIRQKELDRFHTIKPLFEIDASTTKSFRLLNHGGIVYFIGCDEENVGKLLTKTPRQFSTLRKQPDKQPDKQPVEFQFSKELSNGNNFVSYWSDVDINTYKLKIEWERDGFYIDGPPSAIRSEKFLTMSRPWLDKITNRLFPKDWFDNAQPQQKKQLNDCLRQIPDFPVVLFRSNCVFPEWKSHVP